MKCINKKVLLIIVLLCSYLFCGCGKVQLDMPYDMDTNVSSYSVVPGGDDRGVPFAKDLCIVAGDTGSIEEIEAGEDSYAAAALFDLNSRNTIYSKNAYVSLYPASMTKVMTAICAMKYGNKDDLIKCSANVLIDEPGAQLCGFKEGDVLTLDQAMHALIMYSGNDAAIVIAEGISGSVEDFCKLMNSEAKALGATHTNFVNPNGLHDDNHYTTPYDMYLMFNEAIKYDWFNEIIHMDSYLTSYETADGSKKEITIENTNKYINGGVVAPANATVIGGKTGTTSAAGNNLVLLSKDAGGNPFISIVMKAKDRDTLYVKMNSILEEVP